VELVELFESESVPVRRSKRGVRGLERTVGRSAGGLVKTGRYHTGGD
jgi:hypothetical protein